MAEYAFLTTWLLESPREPVWEAIHDQERWPSWWRGVEEARSLPPGDNATGLGSVSRMVWKSLLPYRVSFEVTTTRVEHPTLMEGHAVGELEGTGRWRLYEQDGVTAVLYEWNVRTTKPWMNLFAPLLRPAFEWNHDWVMRRGGEGIAESARLPPLGDRLRLRYLSWCWHSPPRVPNAARAQFWLRAAILNFHTTHTYYGGSRMKLKPLGDRLIVKPIEEEETTASGIVLPETAKRSRRRARSWPSAMADGTRTARSAFRWTSRRGTRSSTPNTAAPR